MNKSCAHFLTGAFATGVLPPYVLKACIDSNWRAGLNERFGSGAWSGIDSSAHSIWFHAASVGEVSGLSPVLEKLRQKHPNEHFVLSTTSATGRREALERRLSDVVSLLPFDHPWIVSRVLGQVNPKLVVITETEIWPNLLFALQGRSIPAVIINGRISDYTFPRYQKLKTLLQPMWEAFEMVLAQTEIDSQRYAALGMPQEKIQVVGSTKYDRRPLELSDQDLSQLWISYGLEQEKPCLVAGSVRAKEDQMVIEAYTRARKSLPDLQLLIAARHPERFSKVAELLEHAELPFNRRSSGDAVEKKPVLLLDTLGELSQAYAIATAAFVGGSLVDIGGHNPLEPAAFRTPVIVGPYTATVRDAVASMKNLGGLREVDSSAGLAAAIEELISNQEACSAAGHAAYLAWQKNLGATERVLKCLDGLLLRLESSS